MTDPKDTPQPTSAEPSTPNNINHNAVTADPHQPQGLPSLATSSEISLEKPAPYRSISNSSSPPPPFEGDNGYIKNSLYWYKGRMGRLSMQAAFLGMIGIMILVMIVMILVMAIGGVVIGMSGGEHSLAKLSLVGMVIVAIPIIVMCCYMIVFYVRRLHDLNHSGWWAIIPFIIGGSSLLVRYTLPPGAVILYSVLLIINTIFAVYVFLAPGSKGVNRFGPPRFTPTHEKVFGWIFAPILALQYVFIGWMLLTIINPPKAPHPHHTDQTIPTPASTTNASTTDSLDSYDAPYPFSAQQLWNQILTITALPKGSLSHEQIESAFHMQMKEVKVATIDHTYLTRAGEEWYFATSLINLDLFGQHKQTFTLNWSNTRSALGSAVPAAMCINVDDIKPSLLAQGWISNPLDMGLMLMSQIKYSKADASLTLFYDADNHCMTQLMIMVNK